VTYFQLHRLKFTYENGVGTSHGVDIMGPIQDQVDLDNGEAIIKVTGQVTTNGMFLNLKFYSSDGNEFGPYGDAVEGSDEFSYEVRDL